MLNARQKNNFSQFNDTKIRNKFVKLAFNAILAKAQAIENQAINLEKEVLEIVNEKIK
jgi:hypothetical protein